MHVAATSVAGVNGVPQNRMNVIAPAATAEHTVMADAGLDVVTLHVGPEAAAQFLGSERLADGTDVVALTFDGKQRSAPDRRGVDAPATPFEPAERAKRALETRRVPSEGRIRPANP